MPGMRRREFVSLFGGAVVALPVAARAQQEVAAIGCLGSGSSNRCEPMLVAAFSQAVARIGLYRRKQGRD